MEGYIDELIDRRAEARKNKDWKLADEIRDYLDSKSVFIFDTPNGQEVYSESKGTTRQQLVDKINKDKRAEKLFDAWLYSIQKSAGIIK